MVFRMNYTKLTNNLIDLVKEEQAKLGYRKEAIRLYYPLSSLQHIDVYKRQVIMHSMPEQN